MVFFAAVDLGASSGRVMLAEVDSHGVRLDEANRFPNRPRQSDGALRWDVGALWAGVQTGLRAAAAGADRIAGIGIDSWAVDYGLLGDDGTLLADPVHYRDGRTAGLPERVDTLIGAAELYRLTGVQRMPINTIYQLVAARDSTELQAAQHALLIPDLFAYWLTGTLATELTNASTTGLLDVRSRSWSEPVFAALGLRTELFPLIVAPGTDLGPVRGDLAGPLGVDGARVTAIGSHDTASAVAGVPATDEHFAYISCGTWSLVGVEVSEPITTDAAREANFSNELGIDGTVRFLRNVMGLWLLQESVRAWESAGLDIDLGRLLADAGREPADRSVIDPDRPEFLAPNAGTSDMPARIRAECARSGVPVPDTPAQVARCVLDSLAGAYRRAVREAAELSGVDVQRVHLVGGGAQNALLCQRTADACGVPVIAGPVEAAAYGNVLVQARARGVVSGGLPALRGLIASSAATQTYRPQPGVTARR